MMGLAGELRRWPLAAVERSSSRPPVALIARPVSSEGHVAPGEICCVADSHSEGFQPAPASDCRRACVVICVMAISVVLLGRDARAVHTGPNDLDSLHYHLTQSAQMVQTHDLNHLHQTSSSDGTLYYPFNIELLDAVTMLGPAAGHRNLRTQTCSSAGWPYSPVG